jgi:hypothetical protein
LSGRLNTRAATPVVVFSTMTGSSATTPPGLDDR